MSRPRAPLLVSLVALAVLAAATVLMARGIEPFATWYYVFAWVPTLLLADAAIARREERWFLFGRFSFALTLFLWSAPFWLLFEVLNLRLANWFYVYVPDARAARWAGILLSFATVLPAILLSERLLAAFGVARGLASRPFRATEGLRVALQGSGVVALALCLARPSLFFPLAWVALALAVDPFVHAREPGRSLLGDLERGRPGRILRLLLGGLAIGLLWEIYNQGARGKWIYTVPGFEEGKLFEMPVLGFLGFPVFALGGFAVWQALIVTGLAAPREGRARPAPAAARVAGAALAASFCACALLAMERATIASMTPRLTELPGVPAARLAAAGWDVFALAAARPTEVARAARAPEEEAASWVEMARLAALRGLGAENAGRLQAAGILTVRELAGTDPEALARRLSARGRPIPPPRLRIWVQAAREAQGS